MIKALKKLLYSASLVLLSPILIVQGLWAKKKTLRLPEPEGARTGQLGQGKKLSVLILGDSAGAGVGVDQQKDALSGQLSQTLSKHYDVSWKLTATTGFTTQDCLDNLKKIPTQQENFDYILISLGVNDVTSNVMP